MQKRSKRAQEHLTFEDVEKLLNKTCPGDDTECDETDGEEAVPEGQLVGNFPPATISSETPEEIILDQEVQQPIMLHSSDTGTHASGICPYETYNIQIPQSGSDEEISSLRTVLEKVRDRKHRLLQLELLDREEDRINARLEGLQSTEI